jgi:hypothetical protein
MTEESHFNKSKDISREKSNRDEYFRGRHAFSPKSQFRTIDASSFPRYHSTFSK